MSHIDMPVTQCSADENVPSVNCKVNDLVNDLRRKGVKIWYNTGNIHFQAPKNAITHAEIHALRMAKAGVLRYLEKQSHESPMSSIPVSQSTRYAPLSFSQLAHWNLYELSERASLCVTPLILRINRRLDAGALEVAAEEVLRRHDALRTTIVLHQGGPLQRVSTQYGAPRINHIDWSGRCAAEISSELKKIVENPKAINVVTEPLVQFDLCRVNPETHIIVIWLEHLVTDGISTNILAEELLSSYKQLANGNKLCLPKVPLQFPEFASRQREYYQFGGGDRVAPLAKRLAGYGRIRFPSDGQRTLNEPTGWSIAPFSIHPTDLVGLAASLRRLGTTLPMGAFAAYAWLVLRWCSVEDAVIAFQIDGRSSAQVGHSIGYYAFPLYLRLHISGLTTFSDLLGRVVEEYCTAFEQADFSYYDALSPRPDFTRNTCFNWLPSNRVAEDGFVGGIDDAQFTRLYPDAVNLEGFDRDTEPLMLIAETTDRIFGGLHFSKRKLSHKSMQNFVHCYVRLLSYVAQYPNRLLDDFAITRATE